MIAPLEAKTAEPFGHAHIANNIVAGLVVGERTSAMASGAKHAQGIHCIVMTEFLDRACVGNRAYNDYSVWKSPT